LGGRAWAVRIHLVSNRHMGAGSEWTHPSIAPKKPRKLGSVPREG
jgi:hypothetical protein